MNAENQKMAISILSRIHQKFSSATSKASSKLTNEYHQHLFSCKLAVNIQKFLN
jgi:hypothetical protein